MINLGPNFISIEDRNLLQKFIGTFQKCGNKQRSLSNLIRLFSKLKRGLAGFPIVKNYPLHKLSVTEPLELIHKSIYNLKPAFLLRRVIKSGKRYDLPVPISENRATFMAISWLRQFVLKNNKNGHSLTMLLASEISALSYNEGSAKDFLRKYIDIAIDQQPFNRFIKRKRYSISKSRRTKIAKNLKKINDKMRRLLRARKYHNTNITRKINKHNIRDSVKKHQRATLRKKAFKNYIRRVIRLPRYKRPKHLKIYKKRKFPFKQVTPILVENTTKKETYLPHAKRPYNKWRHKKYKPKYKYNARKPYFKSNSYKYKPHAKFKSYRR